MLGLVATFASSGTGWPHWPVEFTTRLTEPKSPRGTAKASAVRTWAVWVLTSAALWLVLAPVPVLQRLLCALP